MTAEFAPLGALTLGAGASALGALGAFLAGAAAAALPPAMGQT